MSVYMTPEQINEFIEQSKKTVEKLNISEDEFRELVIEINANAYPMDSKRVAEVINTVMKKYRK